MHNTNRSSHVKTEVSFPSIYCSNEVLHFDPGGQEETVELLLSLGLWQPKSNKHTASLSGITIKK